MKDKVLTTLVVGGIVTFIICLLVWGCWSDNNGIRISTSKAYNHEMTEAQKQLEYPVEVTARIEYDGSYINSESRIVEFCDLKPTKKQMKAEMKVVWKQMKKGCE